MSATPRVDVKREPYNTDVAYAVKRHDIKTLKRLIDAQPTLVNTDVNMGKGTASPLHLATNENIIPAVILLIEHGADVDKSASNGNTSLIIASHKGYLEIARLLIKGGADINKPIANGATPLFLASQNGHVDIVNLLIERGADVDASVNSGATPLCVASQAGHVEVVRLLLDNLANINKSLNTGATPLFLASQNGHVEVVRLLLENGANVNKQMTDEATPLFIAAYYGYIEIARLLIDRDADINKPRNGLTPLCIASQNGHIEVVRLLLERGADINKSHISGATALYIATQKGYLEIARLLVERGADINKPINDNATPLFAAANAGNPELVRLLLEHGADTNASVRVGDGTTYPPLWAAAASSGRLDVVKLLVEAGATISNFIIEDAISSDIKTYLMQQAISVVPLNTNVMPAHEHKTCYDPIAANNVNIKRHNYARFYIKTLNIIPLGCYDEETLKFYNTRNKTFYKCKDTVPMNSLQIRNSDIINKPLIKLDFKNGAYYVYKSEYEQVKVNNDYKLVPTEESVGRIASESIIRGGIVRSADHCQTYFTDKIHKIYKLQAGGRRVRKTHKRRRGGRKGTRRSSRR